MTDPDPGATPIVLVDTSLLVRLFETGSPMTLVAERAMSSMLRARYSLAIVGQNLVEFWSVATRPTSMNGLGLMPSAVAMHVDLLRTQFLVLPDPEDWFDHWLALVMRCAVTGKQVHDARLAAVAAAHRAAGLLTFNIKHFERFGVIPVIDAAVEGALP